MTRKFINILTIALVAFCGFASKAQTAAGDEWTIYPIITNSYDKVVDTDSKVYFLSGGSLFSIDKKSNETYFYDYSNKLSGIGIENIYYNHEKKFLLIAYSDSNMDVLYDDGRIVCLPDIKDAMVTEDKSINDVAFGEGRIAVATNFGIVLYDDQKLEVVESGNFHQAVDLIAICDGKLFIYLPVNPDNPSRPILKWTNIDGRHNKLESFNNNYDRYLTQLLKVKGESGDKLVLVYLSSSKPFFSIGTLNDVDDTKSNLNVSYTDISVNSKVNLSKDGFYFRSGDKLLLYDKNCQPVDEIELEETLTNSTAGLWNGKESVWFGGAKGVANYNLASSTPTVLSDWYKPEATSCREVSFLTLSPDGQRIYVHNVGPTVYRQYLRHFSSDPDGIKERQRLDVIENGTIRDISLAEASADENHTQNAQIAANDKGMYGGVTRMAEDPNDKNTLWIGNGLEGLYVVKDGKEVWKFNIHNAPFHSYWRTRIFDVNFDPQGNLWVGMGHADEDFAPYIVLPAAKMRKGYDKITESDWQWPRIDYTAAEKDLTSLIARKSNYMFLANGNSGMDFCILDTKGTYDNFKDDVSYHYYGLTDQDGNTVTPNYYICFVEDQLGRVWLGTSQGVFYFNATAGIKENTNVIRPKVPRNDGTNYADFLLDSDQINAIAVDPSNRKWLATDASGVYLVSPNGDKIIRHFDTTNSPLPSNRVTAVACDPNSNTVYFGTMQGLYAYKSDSSPAKEDYSEIYAYPNPVRPEYSGPVTITGLMDNSLVKIADSAGNVFYQGRSEGGMVTWDACNQQGERVRSGIYFVYVSSGGDGQNASGAVTKIMVIN